MARYGYTYRSISTYNTVIDETHGPVVNPFVPNTNSNSEGQVTKKTIVPIATKSYGDDYPARGDDYGSPSKVDELLSKVPNEASRPKRFTPVSSIDRRQSPQPTSFYNGENGCGNHGGNKEGCKPVAYDGHNGYGGSNKEGCKPVSYDGHDGYGDYGSNKEGCKPVGYNGHNGYSDYGSNKEGHKPTIRNDNHDGYSGPTGYGDYGNYGRNKGHKPIGGTVRSDNYDGHNGYGDYSNYGNKEGLKPVGDTFRYDNYDGHNSPNDYGGYGDYDSKEGYKSNGSPIRNGNYDGYNGANNDFGGYINKEGHDPYGSTTRNNNYDGFHGGNGYSDNGNYGKKEGYRPSGSPILSGNYDRHRPAENYGATGPIKIIPGKPKFSIAAPRKGTQLSEPTNDIDKAIQMLKEAANLRGQNYKEGHNYDDYQRRHDEPTSKFGKGMELVKEAEKMKNIVTVAPHSRYSVPVEPSSPNKDYRDAIGRYGKNFLSRPLTQPKHVGVTDYRNNIDGRDDTEHYRNTSIIDSSEAEKMYQGRRV